MHLKYGIVSEVKKGFVRVKFEEDDGIVSDWLPVLVRKSKTDKESWQMEVNEHAVCLMDEFAEEGVCLGAIPNEEDQPDPGEGEGKFRKLFSDGTFIEYDKAEHKLTVDVKGQLEAKTTGDASVEALANASVKAGIVATVEAPTINLTGNVVVSGTLAAASIAAGAISTDATKGTGQMTIAGDISTTGDISAGGISLKTHIHPGVQSGPGVTGLPE